MIAVIRPKAGNTPAMMLAATLADLGHFVPHIGAEHALRALEEIPSEDPLEEIRQLLNRCAELADELTNAEPDYRHASRLSRISDGLDLAQEQLSICVAAAGDTVAP